ncbi:hypothetical protein ACFQ3N_20040 [Virgibacillus byunsanensis]|uniref:Uncharacterized protein n=1 Tax=Virgibacillus byunsanensis TaxID=570945 RepID=A0ABW3LQF7_9BACI
MNLNEERETHGQIQCSKKASKTRARRKIETGIEQKSFYTAGLTNKKNENEERSHVSNET